MEQPLKVRASLRIVREDKLFGPGVATLCCFVWAKPKSIVR